MHLWFYLNLKDLAAFSTKIQAIRSHWHSKEVSCLQKTVHSLLLLLFL